MSDIVERLRALGREYWRHKPHYEEAADEIDRLRAALKAAAHELGMGNPRRQIEEAILAALEGDAPDVGHR